MRFTGISSRCKFIASVVEVSTELALDRRGLGSLQCVDKTMLAGEGDEREGVRAASVGAHLWDHILQGGRSRNVEFRVCLSVGAQAGNGNRASSRPSSTALLPPPHPFRFVPNSAPTPDHLAAATWSICRSRVDLEPRTSSGGTICSESRPCSLTRMVEVDYLSTC